MAAPMIRIGRLRRSRNPVTPAAPRPSTVARSRSNIQRPAQPGSANLQHLCPPHACLLGATATLPSTWNKTGEGDHLPCAAVLWNIDFGEKACSAQIRLVDPSSTECRRLLILFGHKSTSAHKDTPEALIPATGLRTGVHPASPVPQIAGELAPSLVCCQHTRFQCFTFLTHPIYRSHILCARIIGGVSGV